MTAKEPSGPLRVWPVAARVVLYTVLGVPLVAYLWETLNKVMALDFSEIRVVVAVPVLILFVLLIRLLMREVWRWEMERRT